MFSELPMVNSEAFVHIVQLCVSVSIMFSVAHRYAVDRKTVIPPISSVLYDVFFHKTLLQL